MDQKRFCRRFRDSENLKLEEGDKTMTTYRGNTNGTDYIFATEGRKLVLVYDSADGKCYKSIRVNKKAGFSWKLNKTSVSCDSGQSIDIINLFNKYPAFANATFAHFTA